MSLPNVVPNPPRLRRCAATEFDERTARLWAVRAQVMRAYGNLRSQFHGPPLTVNGIVLCRDAWECALDLALDRAEREDKLDEFSLESWLGARVESEGSAEAKENWRQLMSHLDEDALKPALPENLQDVYLQPLVEVDTFRGLDDVIPVEDDDGAEFSKWGRSVFGNAIYDDDDDDTVVPDTSEAKTTTTTSEEGDETEQRK